MTENLRRPAPTGAEPHAAASGDDHHHGAPERGVWGTREDLPRARFYPQELQDISWHQPLSDPVWTREYGHLRDDDPVLGLYLKREPRALPWWIMKNHHVANLTLDDLPVVVSLCEMCSSAAAFRAEAAGRRLTFRPRGHYNGTIFLEETSTGTLWSPFTGVALTGALRGTTLERLALSQCRWSDWLAMHPTSLVLYGEQALRSGHGSQFSPGSPGIGPSVLASLVRPIDERLPHNTLVLGVEYETKARAYPLQTLERIGPALNDTLGGAEIVIRCRPGTLQALAFHRRVGDRVLSFRGSDAGGAHDEQTGSAWNEMGEAIAGPLAGTQLAYLDSGIEEWYVFAASHPGADIFTRADP
jgi:hypothetical protein